MKSLSIELYVKWSAETDGVIGIMIQALVNRGLKFGQGWKELLLLQWSNTIDYGIFSIFKHSDVSLNTVKKGITDQVL